MVLFTAYASQKNRRVLKIITGKKFITLLTVCFVCFIFAAEVCADTHTAASCSLADVVAAINAASAEDTVLVPAGSCTWSSQLSITKGIQLIGAGIGNTVITGNYTSGNQPLISYSPTSGNYQYNYRFRISGFTFDLNNKSMGIGLGLNGKNAPFTLQTKIRIDHNRFLNPLSAGYGGQYIRNYGCRGVIDNNVFELAYYPMKEDPGANHTWWQYFTIRPGIEGDSMYVEDNVFNGIKTGGIVTDCQFSGRYVYRYNTITNTASSYPLFDMHGNDGTDMCSCFGAEIYGNNVIGNYALSPFFDHRGGKALVFHNNKQSTNSSFVINVTEEHPDSTSPPVTASDGQPQHVSDSYYWNNRRNLTETLATVNEVSHNGDIPLVNRDYWVGKSSFNGTSGMGCGTLAQMNAITTCTDGVAFWATDQSCSDLTGMVGAHPTTPIDGELYKCSNNTWVSHYKPLDYPHPLTLSKPNPPTGVRIE